MGRPKPLTAKLLRAATDRPAVPAPIVGQIAVGLPPAIAAAAAQLGEAPAKVSVEGVEDAEAPPAEAHPLRFATSKGAISGFIGIEPALVFALCDCAVGGTGTEPPFEAEGRPLSNIEMRLARLFASNFAERLAACLGQATGAAVQPAPSETGRQPAGQAYRLFRCLVTLFGQSGELTVGLGRRDLEAIAGPEASAAPATVTLRRHVPAIALRVEVRTAREIMPLGEVRTIAPGHVLRLAARIDAPVAVFADGDKLFDGRLTRGGAGLSVTLL